MYRKRFSRRGQPIQQGEPVEVGRYRRVGGGGRGGQSGKDGKGRQGGTKPGSGPNGFCVCPSCGHRQEHIAGKRCLDQVCPKCGTKMVRK